MFSRFHQLFLQNQDFAIICCFAFFPTCQVRVVRFYQSCCPRPPPHCLRLLLLPRRSMRSALQPEVQSSIHDDDSFAGWLSMQGNSRWEEGGLGRLQGKHWEDLPRISVDPRRRGSRCRRNLAAKMSWQLCSASSSSFSSVHCWTSTWDLPSSVCTAGPQPGTCPAQAQCAPLDLNLGPAQLSVHRWTSTWDLPSSVCTAGPRPGTCPAQAQCAPLDLNLGPAQLSVHRWTSTWDLPSSSSVCTAGPQPGTCPAQAQCAPLDLNLGPSQLSVHRWTLPSSSSVCTAGPQPGTCPAQCAPLDLNLGPSQLSVHRWTSTWDLPSSSSVCTAGPQPGTCPAQCAPLDLNLGPAQLKLSVHRWTSTAR